MGSKILFQKQSKYDPEELCYFNVSVDSQVPELHANKLSL